MKIFFSAFLLIVLHSCEVPAESTVPHNATLSIDTSRVKSCCAPASRLQSITRNIKPDSTEATID